MKGGVAMTIGEFIKNRRIELSLTMKQLAEKVNVSEATISRWESGNISNMKRDKIKLLADALLVSPAKIMGWEDNADEEYIENFDNFYQIDKQSLPCLGEISCGTPKFANEDRESYVKLGTKIHADFCLIAKGDSMVGARIYDGDIVFIRKQPIVENGEIAAVIIDDEATLKRIYYYPEKGKLILQAENPKYAPLVYIGEELNDIRIIGKAIAFQSDIK